MTIVNCVSNESIHMAPLQSTIYARIDYVSVYYNITASIKIVSKKAICRCLSQVKCKKNSLQPYKYMKSLIRNQYPNNRKGKSR